MNIKHLISGVLASAILLGSTGVNAQLLIPPAYTAGSLPGGPYLPLAGGSPTGPINSSSTLSIGGATIGSDALAVTGSTKLDTLTGPVLGINTNTEIRMVDAISAAASLFGCNHTDATLRCLAFDTPSDTSNRFFITGNGTLVWGPGNATQDASMLRLGVGAMGINGSLSLAQQPANAQPFTISGGSTTGSGISPVGALVLGTLNTTGVVPGAVLLSDITKTAAGAGSSLVDLRVGGSSKFKIDLDGNTTFGGTLSATSGSLILSGTGLAVFAGRSIITSPLDAVVRLSNQAQTNTVDITIGPSNLATFNGAVAATTTLRTNTAYSAAGTPLPTCNAGAAGTRAYVTDATLPTYLGAYVSGGAVVAPVFCNGTGWVTD